MAIKLSLPAIFAATALAFLAFFLYAAPAHAAPCLVSAGCTGQSSFLQGVIIQGSDPLRLNRAGTTTPTIGNGLSYTGTFGDVIGGVLGTLTATLGTTIAPNELVGTPGANTVIYTNSAGTGFAGAGTSTPALSSSFSYSGTLGQFISGVSGTLSIAAQGITPSMLANSDFGNFTCAAGVCTIDNGSVSNAMLANSTISGVSLGGTLGALTATNATLTFSGSYDGSAARTVGINLANPNAWTGLQQFANASSSLFSVYGPAYFGRTATTTIDGTGNIVIPSGSGLTNTGRSDGCASWASGVLTSLGVACGTSSGGIAAIGPTGQTSVGPTITLATTTSTTNGITSALTIVGSGATMTFTPSQSGTLTVAGGGTGVGTWTVGQIPYGNGTNAISFVATSTRTYSAEFSNTGTLGAQVGGSAAVVSLATNGVALTKLATIAANTVLGNNTGAVGNVVAFATSTLGIAISDTTGTLTVARGGTGQTTFTSSQLLYGNGTNALSSVATSSGQCTSASGITCSAFTVVGSVSPTFALSAIPNSSLTNSTISGVALGGSLFAHTHDASLTGTSYNGSAAVSDWGLNLTNPNIWTGLQRFSNASSTLFSNTGIAYFGGTATTTIDGTGNITIPSGSGLTNTGRADGCATWASAVLTSTGVACGSGGGGTFPFTPTTNFGIAMNATGTPIWFQAGVYASSTSVIGTTTFASNGNVGVGSTTPYGLFSIAASAITTAADYARPIFFMSTSSDAFGNLGAMFATTTIQTGLNTSSDSGARFSIGDITAISLGGMISGALDQITLNGRINTGDWRFNECANIWKTTTSPITNPTGSVCGDFGYGEDTDGSYRRNTPSATADGMLKSQLTSGQVTAAAGTGASLFLNTAASNQFSLGTTTPVLEVVGMIDTPSSATSSYYYIGFVNKDAFSSTYEVEPTDGCFFVASTTLASGAAGQPNWMAVCKTAGTATIVDTGVASTTNMTATGKPMRFRVEANAQRARFYIQQGGASLQKVAEISTNVPSTTLLSAGLMISNIQAGLGKFFDVYNMKMWWKQPALRF